MNWILAAHLFACLPSVPSNNCPCAILANYALRSTFASQVFCALSRERFPSRMFFPPDILNNPFPPPIMLFYRQLRLGWMLQMRLFIYLIVSQVLDCSTFVPLTDSYIVRIFFSLSIRSCQNSFLLSQTHHRHGEYLGALINNSSIFWYMVSRTVIILLRL